LSLGICINLTLTSAKYWTFNRKIGKLPPTPLGSQRIRSGYDPLVEPQIMAGAHNILVINGPNLNLLGSRETRHYGKDTLKTILARLGRQAKDAKVRLATYQSNSESALVERIQQARGEGVDFIIINPAAYTHTSVAMRDALAAVGIPFVEVHLSNVFAREAFRRESYFTDLAVGIVSGLGAQGYELALEFALQYSRRKK